MSKFLLGIDLGTSSVRAGIYREDGSRLAIAARTYPIEAPSPEISEQDPELWWRGTCEAIRESLAKGGVQGKDIAALSFAGQMHGGVMLDNNDEPVGRAIIWADSRSAGECAEIEALLGKEILQEKVMNRIFPGSFAATAYWMRKHDPRTWSRVRRLLLPKDYIRWRMCGLFNSDASDASASLLFDQNERDWSKDVLDKLHVPIEYLPYIVSSDQMVGVTEGIEDACDLPDGIPIVTGGADQGAAALGNGILDEGAMFVAVGTGGQIVTPLRVPKTSPGLCLNTFCHLPEIRWYLMGATLAAGLSLRWYRDMFASGVPFRQLDTEAETLPPGSAGLTFTPYLAGRRSPVMDPTASGGFLGIRLNHVRGHFVRAVLEGVVFDLRDCLEVMRGMGVQPRTAVISGGGAQSPLWTRILAEVFNTPLAVSGVDEQACFGAALIAGIGVGIYRDYEAAAMVSPRPERTVEPDPENAKRYEELYREWCGGESSK